jgi:hypothetical protein
MERCHGTTKSGDRCKRSATAGSLYCSTHADQATASSQRRKEQDPASPVDEGQPTVGNDAIDVLVAAAVFGVAAVVVLTVGRLFRA